MNFYYSDRFNNIAFGKHPFAELLDSLQPGDTLGASALLAVLDGESEEVFQEAFDHLADMDVTLDISDLPRAALTGEAGARLHLEEKLAQASDLTGSLEETDPLRLYLEEIAAIPVCGDLGVLALELAESNAGERENEDLWTRILNLSLSRVVAAAREMTGHGVLLLDLIQEGSMGLWQRLGSFDGGDLEQFVETEIRQAMSRAVILQAHASGVGGKLRQAMEDYRSVDERLLMELGRNPTVEEIAEAMHMGPEETAVVADMVANARNQGRLKAEIEPEPQEEADEDQSVDNTAYFQMRQRIQELLSELTEQEAKLLTLRFGLEGGLPLDPAQTGAKLGLTAEEAVKLEAAALAKLRK